MSRLAILVVTLLAFSLKSLGCDDCTLNKRDSIQTRLVRRMQPDAQNATSLPRAPLQWGQINFLQTTDTHGWLEGHLKEPNYGADWGDFASFTQHMKKKADDLGVDLLLIDSGDLHDGAGLSDATSPNGLVSNPIFENINYDLLSIGNHELYVSAIAYEHFNQFAKVYGDRYLTSNVQILNPTSGQLEYIGKQFRYFTTKNGLRIMAFGVLYDFTGNSNASVITTGAKMVTQQWFIDAVNYTKSIDMFIVVGHNPAGRNGTGSTLPIVYQAIRKIKPDTPITLFAGHLHIRDTMVYDNKAVSIASGRYCETLGWLAIDGFNLSHYAAKSPKGVPNPAQGAVVMTNGSAAANLSLSKTPSSLKYSRRYLDWNRVTMEYHANGSQTKIYDTQQGKALTAEITGLRQQLNLTALIGCAPKTWCMTCKPFGDPLNIFTGLLADALAYTIVNSTRANNPRLILINTGSIRFDLPEGPFTFDDSFIVSPFTDAFQYLSNVPYSNASQVLGIMNAGPFQKRKRGLSYSDFNFQPMLSQGIIESCENPSFPRDLELVRRSPFSAMAKTKRVTTVGPGYTTSDDFGIDGDDTIHSKISFYNQPNDLQANASFPTDGSLPKIVDLIFLDFIAPNILSALNQTGLVYKKSDIQYYLPPSFTTNSYFPIYASAKWQAGVPNCPIGAGIGA